MWRKIIPVVLPVLLLALAAGGAVLAAEPPPLPAAYWGTVTCNGAPVPSGTVEALIDGVVCGSVYFSDGRYGGGEGYEPKLLVHWPEAVPGKVVRFRVNGVMAGETVEWQSGVVQRVDLTVQTLPEDTQAPTWPAGSQVTAGEVTQTGLTLTWTAARDNVGVTAYRIYRDGEQIAEVAGNVLSYQVTGLSPGTQYTFKVEARDAAGNWTTDGPSVTVTTQAARVSGVVLLEARPLGRHAGVTVRADTDQQAATSADGTFTLSDVGYGTREFVFKAPGYLTRKVTVTVGAAEVDLGTVTLRAGDASGDDRVDLRDLLLLARAYGGTDVRCDFDGSGTVALADLAWLARNYGRRGDTAVP